MQKYLVRTKIGQVVNNQHIHILLSGQVAVEMDGRRVIIVTGANAGIGFGIAEAIVAETHLNDPSSTGDPPVTVVLLCRNASKAEDARQRLIRKYFKGDEEEGELAVQVVLCDLADPKSVLKAAEDVKARFQRLDALIFNAGVMPVESISILAGTIAFIKSPTNIAKSTGDVIIQRKGVMTADGKYGEAFAANTLGHFGVVRELEGLLADTAKALEAADGGGPRGARVIWITSVTAEERFFDINDAQCAKGTHPYESSKRLAELAHLGLFESLREKGIYSYIASPGVALTGLLKGKIPQWLLFCVMILLRLLFVSGMTINPINSATSSLHLLSEDPDNLDELTVYHSDMTPLGKKWTKHLQMDKPATADEPKQARAYLDAVWTEAKRFKPDWLAMDEIHFGDEFNKQCKLGGITDPPRVLRIPFPLPPLPMPPTPLMTAPSIPSTSDASKSNIPSTAPTAEGPTTDNLGSRTNLDDRPATTQNADPSTAAQQHPTHPADSTAPASPFTTAALAAEPTTFVVTSAAGDDRAALTTAGGEHPGTAGTLGMPVVFTPGTTSRYRFKPTICTEADEEEEIYKVEVRGWKLQIKVMEVLSALLPVCHSVSCLVFWNCGLEEAHFSLILSTVLSSNVRNLAIDQNPLIPDHLFSYLITDDSLIKSLSLRMNRIGDAGAKAIAGSLKSNRVLTSLNLWDNMVGKDGAIDIAEVLSNYALMHDEIILRRKAIMELEKQRRDQEEDPVVKKAKGRINTGHGRNSSANAKIKSEETLVKQQVPDAKSAKKGPAGKAAKGKGGAEAPPQKRTPEAAPPAPAAATARKGAAAAANAAAAADDKKAAKGDKKGGSTAKGSKKGKVEEAREEAEEQNTEVTPVVEPMFERNGQWFVLGNRTLSSLNLAYNNIAEVGLKAFSDAVSEQEGSAENAPEGMIGLFRLVLQGNLFDKDSTVSAQLLQTLLARNPYVDQETLVEKSLEPKEDESDEGNSVLEEET
ncbi:hypothetical protein HK101_011199 [Irineochytrium annulatum]|nr:hypothetical protein HK101_011199 [Irineochytrium annulatum]